MIFSLLTYSLTYSFLSPYLTPTLLLAYHYHKLPALGLGLDAICFADEAPGKPSGILVSNFSHILSSVSF